MKSIQFIWPAAAILYLAFIGWYDGLSGPLSSDEIDAYIEAVEGSDISEERVSLLRRFLEEDDGEDFVMVNAILLRDPPLLVEGIEPGDTAREALDRYMAYMMPALLSRASHPIFVGRAALPAIEKTIAFPVTPFTWIGGPKIVVALFLVSVAAIGHLIFGSRRPS